MPSVSLLLRLHRRVALIDKMKREDRSLFQRTLRKVVRAYLDHALARGYGAFIGKGAVIAPDVKFVHGLHGIFIGGDAAIGEGCRIFHHVTIGSKKRSDGRYVSPQIGRGVTIGANATLIGRCRIEDGALIGAGVVLVDAHIPANATIINKSAYDLTNQRFVHPQ